MTAFLRIAAFLVLIVSNVFAGDKWDKIDYFLLATATATHTLDYSQTLHTARNPDNYKDLNPMLGDHPSEVSVRNYFIVSMVAKIVIAELLPSKWRKAWLGGWTLVNGACVANNYSQGLKFEW
jgi:hypothetical protein